ncbi:MAG: ABC transporter, partial [Clostridia bacterium]|nr:ABC transporter [Clostridia bacterium]
ELENGAATEFKGAYDEYTAYKMQTKAAQKAVERVPSPALSTNSEHKESYYRSKEERAQDAKRRTRIKKIEDEIAALEEEDESLNADLASPEVTANFALLTEKCNRLEEIKNKLDELYEEYEMLI